MKKLTVLLVLAVLLVFTMGTSAQEFSAENIKFVGGITYNTYDGTVTMGDITEKNDVDAGLGFYLGGQYWINPEMAVELGYDRANGKIEDKFTISGFYGKFVYNVNKMFDIKGGLARYGMEVDNSPENTSGKGLGILIGGDYKYPINEGMSLMGSANYRMLEIDIDDTESNGGGNLSINMSGFSIGGGVCIKY